MVIRLCFFILAFLNINMPLGIASPATNIQLAYDVEAQILHVEADHPSDRLERYFIRRVLITNKTGKEQEYIFYRQARADKFIADLDYSAEPGDYLNVQLFCSKGGLSQAGIDIPKPKDKNEKTPISN